LSGRRDDRSYRRGVWRSVADRSRGRASQPLCADIDGFSLHAAVRCEAHDRTRLEQL
jgi:hypothetical protein